MRFRPAAACLLALPLAATPNAAAASPCGGVAIATWQKAPDPRPQIRMPIGGVLRPALIDTGATASLLFDDAAPRGSELTLSLGLQGFASAHFTVEPNASAPLNERDGAVIGTDVLSRGTVLFSASGVEFSAAPCDPEKLAAAGFRRLDQSGRFSAPSAPHAGPNVPVLPIAIGGLEAMAQLDTGYDDRVYPYSVDINRALLDALRANHAPLTPLAPVTVGTCSGGSELRDVYASPAPLRLGAGEAALATLSNYVLIAKSPNACGGIADMPFPAAQLSARFLDLFAGLALDGPGEAIWVKPK